MIRVVVASGNRHKVAELAQWLAQADGKFSVASMADFGRPPEIAETASTFAGNAALKAVGIASWLRTLSTGPAAGVADWVLADDSGLCIDALDGDPGVLSARFAGVGASDAQNNQRAVAQLRERGVEWSPAGYVCVLALCKVAEEPWTDHETAAVAGAGVHVEAGHRCAVIEGRCRGEFGVVARGDGGFGYDPHFWIDGRRQTYAEISRGEKAVHSHRGQALARLLPMLRQLSPVD